MNKHVMIDLETLGVTPGAALLSVGATYFDPASGALGPEFHQGISFASSHDYGMRLEPGTMAWWLDQTPEAQATLRMAFAGGSRLLDVLVAFRDFITHGGDPDVRVWGNGADFDLPLLAAAYQACDLRMPWKPYVGRCYRTLKNLLPDVRIVRTGVHHDALDDARSQAEHAVRLLTALGGLRGSPATTDATTTIMVNLGRL